MHTCDKYEYNIRALIKSINRHIHIITSVRSNMPTFTQYILY